LTINFGGERWELEVLGPARKHAQRVLEALAIERR
jgi:hypothetical protein